MTLTCFPFDNTPTATEAQWSDFGRMLSRDGVDGVPTGTALKVTAGTGLNVNIAAGAAYVRGMTPVESGTGTLGISTNPTSNPRLDLIVIRVNWATNAATYTKIEGTPAPSPSLVEPTPVYSGTTYDLPLAVVRVEANDTISSVTDRRQFLPTNGIVPSTSGGRPNPRGRPMIAYEMDTDRVISTKDGTTWNVGLGNDIYRPGMSRSTSPGTVTATAYTGTLGGGTATPVFDYDFTAPISGAVLIGIGAWLQKSGGDIHLTCVIKTSGGTVVVDNDEFTLDLTSDVPELGATLYAESIWALTPNTSYNASFRYRVKAGTGYVRMRSIKVQALP